MRSILLLINAASSLSTLPVVAQRIADREVKYEYQRLPLTLLDKSRITR